LGEIGSEAAVNPLITALQDPDSGVRRSVAAALGEIGSEAAVNPLIAALQDSDSGVRTNTARSLGKIGSEAAVNSLITALQNPDDTSAVQISLGVRSFASGQATCASGQIGLETGHIRNIIRGNAAWALGEIGSGTAVNPLISALQDPEVWVRANTAAALGKIGSDIAVTPLISALQDPEVAVRANVTCALGEIGSDIAVTPLISALQDPEVWVRANAVAALGEIGSEEVVNSLITALQNPDNEVRRSAARALGETDSDAAVKTLIAALQEQNYVGVWLDAADVLIDTLEESENPIVRGLLMRNLQWNRASFVTDALINRLNIQAEVLSNRYRAIASLSHQHHLQNLADSSDLLQTLSDLALREGEDRFIRYGALLLLSSINTPEALSLLDAHQPDFLALIEANFEAKLPFYLPNPLPSDEIESPEPFVEPTMIAAVDPYTSPSNSLPVDTLPQLIIPSIDQGDDPGDNLDDVSADPPETLDEAIAQLERPPAVCRFPWVAKNWSRCRN
ncbi:MAG: HEAT repeat domain-containing protein, partial [Leptolyngbyaceae cyanobacterium MO_188.B28]|nr:HEAT repeat domain-containing protein [Leptolyngbyaceae cyanobacterium MO_188.B28]